MIDAPPLILLAPSEDKASGGHPGRLRETAAQRWVREGLVDLAENGTAQAQQRAFAVKGLALERARADALALQGRLPLLPALERYTGVAFRALDPLSLPRPRWHQICVLSSLRGLVRGDEPVPSYKLKLGGLPGLKAHWREHLPKALEKLGEGTVWDLLPGEHASLLEGWVRPRHSLVILEGDGRAITHFSKHYRGLVARWLLEHQTGDPRRILRGRIPGCVWEGATENPTGGVSLVLRRKP